MRDVLLDTNIIVDIALARMPHYDDAKIIFQAAQDKQIAIYVGIFHNRCIVHNFK